MKYFSINIEDKNLPSNRNFGIFFSLLFLISAWYFSASKFSINVNYLLAISFFFFIAAIFFPNILAPLNKIWIKFGLVLGRLINPIVIGVLFLFIIVPVAYFFRLIGRDELDIKIEKTKSYWKKRNPDDLTSESFDNQF
jgi:hypothetical protein